MKAQTRLMILAGCIVVGLLGLVIVRSAMHGHGGAGSLQAAFDAEFLTRPDGYIGLQEHYGFSFPSDPKQMDPGLMYRAVADGAVDVIDGFATDGRIPAYGLLVLQDDKGFFPPYYAAPVVRRATLDKHKELKDVLSSLAGKISDRTMQRLNYEADERGRKASEIAREFLVRQGMIPTDAKPGSGKAGTVAIGSKHFTEQEILGELMAILIECKTDLSVDRRLNLGGTMICFNALKAGDLDLYAEYTGTGLVNILKRNVIADPDRAYETVQSAFEKEYNLIWLAPFGFNNTYTLTMRADHAEKLAIKTISDLAGVIRKQAQR